MLDIHQYNAVSSIAKAIHLWTVSIVVIEGLPPSEDIQLTLKTTAASVVDILLQSTGCQTVRELSKNIWKTLNAKSSTGQ